MKKRMLAGLLSLAMVLSMFPTALAAEGFTPADESEQNEPVCICETRCTEEAVNEDCPVCNGGAGYTACVGPAAEPQEDEPVCDCDVLCTEETVNADCPVCSGEGGFAACAGVPAEPEEDGSSVPWTELTPADPVDNPDRALMNSDGVYEVSTAAKFAEAIADIEQSGEPEATISLTAPIELRDDTLGVADTLITITSSDATPVLLTLGDSTLRLAGDVTLENIYISANTIYAEGYALTLDDGFGGGDDGKTRMTVYGGSDRDLKVNTTSVTVKDGVYKLISGGNSAGTLTGDTYVEFGGKANFPTAAAGAEKDDYVGTKSENYNLYLKAKGEANWNGPVMDGMDYEYGILPYGIYGGGTCGNTEGNTEVVMTGGTVYQIFGGGAARRNPSHTGRLGELDDLGRVSGNTSVTVIGGEVKSVYGGGYNDIFVFGSYEYEDSGVPADAREQRAVVKGSTYVEISGDAHVPACEQHEDTSASGADCPAVYGGSFHSTVYNTEVVIGGGAVIESGEKNLYGYGVVYGAGCNDIVQGTTSVLLTGNAVIGNGQNKAGASVVSQGQFSAITPMGRTSQSRCYLGGAIYDHPFEIQNIDNAEYAAVAEVSGGSVDVLMAGVKSRVTSKQPRKTCSGNVLLKQSGGNILAIESGSVYSKNMVIEGNADIFVTGGTTKEYILGRYATSSLGQSVIDGDCTLTFSGCGSADAFRMSPLIWAMDTVLVTDDAHVAVFGDHTLFGSDKKPFTVPLYQVNDLTIDAGSALAFSQKANITGNLVVNGGLNLTRPKVNIPLLGLEISAFTAEGTATGNGQLLPIEAPKNGTNYGIYFEPVVDEEYVYAQKDGSSMQLTLANAGNTGLYVDRKEKTADQDVWYIAQQIPQEVTWWKSLYIQSPSGKDNWNLYQSIKGGKADPNTTVSISQSDYDGQSVTFGVLGDEYVFDRTNPNNRLSAKAADAATSDNPLKIYYKLAPHTVTYEYAGDVPAGAPALPAAVDTWYRAKVSVATAPAMDGYTFSGWKVKSPADVEIKDGKLTMPHDDVVLVGSWTKIEQLYTVTYTDGVDDEVVFEDQMTGGLHEGDPTPAFKGTPVRDGYTFEGWRPEVADIVTGDARYVAQWKAVPEYTVSYDLNGGTGKDGVSYDPETVKRGEVVTIKDAPHRRGYTFEGWSHGETSYDPGDTLTVLADITLTAQWRRDSTGGGDDGNDDYILHYESNGGTKYKDERYDRNTVVKLDKVPVREDYTFTGWYADEELTERITKIKMTSDKTVYAGWERSGVPGWLNSEDHFAYIVGYADGTVRPQNSISRAEVATIFFRLLNEDVRKENLTTANTFADVNEGMWFNTAVSTMAELGVIKGRSHESFVPDAPITRAEFAAICARFDHSGIAANSCFTDIAGHWAQEEIGRAAALGWVQGYADGTFRPDAPITRAEAVTMINRVLKRLPESEEDLLPNMRVWPDNQPGDWYYLAVQEATNSHDFIRKGVVHEHWTKLTSDPDWTKYQ